MTYRVSGKHPVLGHAPGTEFEADMPQVQAERLLACGALAVVPDAPAAPAPAAKE